MRMGMDAYRLRRETRQSEQKTWWFERKEVVDGRERKG